MPPTEPAEARVLDDPRALRNPIGVHVKVGKGLVAGAFAAACELGAEAIQIFVGNPRGWARSAGSPGQDRAFRAACDEAGIRVVIHTPYLVNLGSPTPSTYQSSVQSVAHNLARAAEIGAEGVVVHTGSCVAAGSAKAAMRQVREGLLPILETLGSRDDGGPWLLLEPTAGQGRSLCAGVDDLEAYLAALDFHPRAGICLDTCHVFAAGAPLDEPGGTTGTVDRITEIGGAGRLRLVHANDSMDVRGAFKDRHQKIGDGHIGTAAFEELFAHPDTAGVPFVLETPGSRDPGDFQLPLLKKLREHAADAGRASVASRSGVARGPRQSSAARAGKA